MQYIVCPSCETLLADKQLIFNNGLKEITEDTKLTDEIKDKKKVELLNSLGLTRYCCRSRVLGYLDIVKIVKPRRFSNE